MRTITKITFFLIFSSSTCYSQTLTPACPSPYVYMDGSSFIMAYDPSLPLSSTNPFSTGIPVFGSGLTLMPNISGGTLTPTFYTTSGGNYYYWSGASWVNTGHSTGNSAAVNIAGCNGTIYNIVGSSGQVYSYNGTSNGSLLTTLSGFNGGGPYDLVTDCNCNFYALNTTTLSQALSMYNTSGGVQCTYTLNGMPDATGGGGFAIIGDMIYVKNNNTPGFYIGTISGSGITFTSVSTFTNSPGDFASCPVCNPGTNLNGTNISGSFLSCTNATTNIVVTTSAVATFSWSGPGIISSPSNSYVTVNSPGIYTCVVSANGCPPSQLTLTTSVSNYSVSVAATLNPSGDICMQGGTSINLSVTHSLTTDLVTWTNNNMAPINNVDSLLVVLPGSYSVTVTDVLSGCSTTAVANVIQSPSISLALSDNTLCLFPHNNSPASITLTPSGATNYTLYTSTNYSTNTPNGNPMILYPITSAGNLSPFATATLIGSNNGCVDTAYTNFVIVPNPTLALSAISASVCPGKSQAFTASGATNYFWGGSSGLNILSGPNVTASPLSTSMYTVMGTDNICNSITRTLTLTLMPTPSMAVAASSTIVCLGSPLNFTASGSATSFTWYPTPGVLNPLGNVVSAIPLNSQYYTVTGSLNSCTNSASVFILVVTPPTLSLSLSEYTFCAQNFNGSPTSINLSPAGASNYTLTANGPVNVINPNGPAMQITSTGAPLVSPAVITASLSGVSSVCAVTITKQFTILPNPVLNINPANANICPGQNQVFVVNGASTYTWQPMPNYTLVAANSINAKPLYTSFYSVNGSAAGCNSYVKNAVLVVLPIPAVTVSPLTSTVCSGGTVTLNAGGDGQNYSWFPSGSLMSNFGTQVTAKPYSTQVYTVVASINSCTNQAVTTVSIIPIPTISAVASQPTVCSSALTQLTASGANSYLWAPNDHLNFVSGYQVQANPPGDITYTVKGFNGICTGTNSVHITVVKRPDMSLQAELNRVCYGSSFTMSAIGAQTYTWLPPDALMSPATQSQVIIRPLTNTNYTILGSTSLGSITCQQQLNYSVSVVPVLRPNVSNNISICEGDKTLLTANGGNTYSWMPSQGLSATNLSRVVASPSISMIYTVNVSDNTYCGVNATIMVNVNPKPSVYAGRDSTYNLSDAIFIAGVGTGSLSWISGEGIACKSCDYTRVFPSRAGCYVVEAVNDYDCKATDDICIDLTEEFSIYIPNSFTPNKDGLNDVFLIYGEHISDVSMEIFNRWGLLVYSSNDITVGWDGTNNGAACVADTYTYKIQYTGLNRKIYSKTGHVFIIK